MRGEAGDAGYVLKLLGGGRGGAPVVGVGGRLGQVYQHEDAHGQGVHAAQGSRHLGEGLGALGRPAACQAKTASP